MGSEWTAERRAKFMATMAMKRKLVPIQTDHSSARRRGRPPKATVPQGGGQLAVKTPEAVAQPIRARRDHAAIHMLNGMIAQLTDDLEALRRASAIIARLTEPT